MLATIPEHSLPIVGADTLELVETFLNCYMHEHRGAEEQTGLLASGCASERRQNATLQLLLNVNARMACLNRQHAALLHLR